MNISNIYSDDGTMKMMNRTNDHNSVKLTNSVGPRVREISLSLQLFFLFKSFYLSKFRKHFR